MFSKTLQFATVPQAGQAAKKMTPFMFSNVFTSYSQPVGTRPPERL
jgi:hypothetical protein